MITKQTAIDLALTYREIETAEGLLKDISQTIARRELPEIRDAFGRHQNGLQLGVPTGDNSHRLFNVPWPLAKIVIEAHLAAQQQLVAALNAKALIEAAE